MTPNDLALRAPLRFSKPEQVAWRHILVPQTTRRIHAAPLKGYSLRFLWCSASSMGKENSKHDFVFTYPFCFTEHRNRLWPRPKGAWHGCHACVARARKPCRRTLQQTMRSAGHP